MFLIYLRSSQLCHWRLESSVILHRVKWWIFTSRDGVKSQNTSIFIVRISGFWQQLPLYIQCERSCAPTTMQEGFSRRVVYGDKMLINLELLLFNSMTLFYIRIVLLVRLKFQEWCCVILESKHYTSEFPIKILRTLHFSTFETCCSDLILSLDLKFSWRWILSLRPSVIWRWVVWIKEGNFLFPENGGSTFLQNVLTVYQALRRHSPEGRNNIHF
jgi:hypothetical protein